MTLSAIILSNQCPPCTGAKGHPLALLAAVAAVGLLVILIGAIFRKKGTRPMSKTARITIVSILAAAICFIIILKQRGSEEPSSIIDTNVPGEALPQRTDLPRLVDLGAETCIPCKLMAPILKELKEEYAGRVEIEFLDIDKNPDLVGAYRVRIKPTQIFYDASGKELFRHEGFYSKEDILTKFKELGIVVK